MALGGPDPAFFRHHHGDGIGTDHLQLAEGPGLFPLYQRRAARVAVLFRHRQQFFLDQGLEAGGAAEDFFQFIAFLGQLVLLSAYGDLFQPGQVAQLELEHRLGLGVGQAEALHQGRLGLVLGANNVNDLVDIQEGNQVAFEDMNALEDTRQAMFQPPAHGLGAEGQPLPQDAVQAFHPRPAVDADHIQVYPVGALQIGAGEQVAHQGLAINAVGARHDDQAGGIFVVGLVPQVRHHGQLPGLHLLGDLLQHPGPGNLVGQGGYHNVAALTLPDGAHAQATPPGLIHGDNVFTGRDDLGLGGKIGSLHMLAELGHRRFGRLQQAHCRRHHFPQVVRGHVGGHPHRNTGGAIEQHVGHLGGQYRGLLHGAVKIGHPVHCALGEFAQQHIGVGGQPRFGVAHGGE